MALEFPRASPVMVDLITINAIILALVLFLYGAVWMSPEMGFKSIVAAILLVAGGFMAFFLGLISLGILWI